MNTDFRFPTIEGKGSASRGITWRGRMDTSAEKIRNRYPSVYTIDMTNGNASPYAVRQLKQSWEVTYLGMRIETFKLKTDAQCFVEKNFVLNSFMFDGFARLQVLHDLLVHDYRYVADELEEDEFEVTVDDLGSIFVKPAYTVSVLLELAWPPTMDAADDAMRELGL